MINLLFISDSPKAKYTQSVLQPVLKVKIDVVTDFDHGLKNVFEKRPATVCIQEHIGGIAAESVARHIQMLLGTVAPTFILLHEGGDKSRTIKGLFEYLIDISQPNEIFAEDVQNTLKSLLDEQWEKNYIPPKSTTISDRSTAVVPEELHDDLDMHVFNSISDIEKSCFSVVDSQPSPFEEASDTVSEKLSATRQSETSWSPENVFATAESDRALSIDNDLAEILLMAGNKGQLDENSAVAEADSGVVPIDSPKPATVAIKPPQSIVPEPRAQIEVSSGKAPLKKSVISTSGKKETQNAVVPVAQQQVPRAPTAAAFRIKQHILQDEEFPSEDLLIAFEESRRSNSLIIRRSIVVVSICALCAIGGWYLVTQKPQLVSSLKQRIMPPLVEKQILVAVPSPQKLVLPSIPPPAVAPTLPTFIPKDGYDSSYALKNPGWERYIGTRAEFRVFISAGRIQAVQILAVKDVQISDSLIKSILQELTGSPEYQIISRSTKSGLRIENGRIQNKGEVMIYRKNGTVKALVVSVI